MNILNVPNESDSPLVTSGIFGNDPLLADSLKKLDNNNTLHTDQIPDLSPNITPTQYLNQEILPITQTELQKFSTSSDFSNNIELAFGYGCNVELAHTIVDNLANGQGIPNIQIIPQSQLKADGAFGNNTIYISQDLFNPQQTNSTQAVNVLLEEIGHYIDSQINIQDAPGDEGAIFAKIVQNQPLAPGELIALKAENDHGILNINGQNIAVEHADTPGVFLVDNTGKISIDFLADSGSYHNEMAIFSLQNMDNLTPGSADYIKEAARRALSNSALGYTVIIDINEGAKFVGELGESNRNDGNYSGLKAFSFTPGDKIAFMLVPEGTVQKVFDNPNAGSSQRPLFSIAAANPNSATQIGQLLPGTYGWEDIRNDQNTDADYNDIIFQVKGATVTLTDIGGLFASGKDWRNLPLAQEIIAFASQQNNTTLTAKLSQDTGIINLDGITNNPEIAGSINNADNLSKLQAKFSDGSNFVDILSELKANGNFILNKDKLAAIKGNQLADGEYQLTLRSEDKSGNISESLVKFTLDTTQPGIPTEIGLKNDGDTVTNQTTPTITGKGENGALIEIFDGQNKLGQTTVVNGFWEITTSQITDGLKNLTITATDISGNKSDASNTEFTIDSALPQINITNPPANAILNPGARLQGTVNGTGSTIDKLSYRFDNASEINVPVNNQGAFDIELNLTGVSGQQNLIIKAIDLAGNSTETTQSVVVGQAVGVGFMLDTLFDSAPIGDSRTTYDTVNLLGQTDANATVTLQQTGASTTADTAGKFKFTGVSLTLGDNSFTVNSTNTAGNKGQFTTIIKRVDQDNSDVVLDWNATLLNAIYEDKTAPPIASRNMAITQTAVFDAINSITGTYENYHFTGTAPTGASPEAAAASAAHQVLVNLYPQQKDYFDNALTASLAEITDGTAEDNGVTFGRTVADNILSLRSADGATNTVTYTPGTHPGQWQPTAPEFAPGLLPQWGQVTPFGLTSGNQFRPDGVPALNSADYTIEFNQVKDLGSINSTTRTTEQTEIAQFWADGSGTFTPPGHWNQIAQNVAAEKSNSLVDNARLFALLDISLADAGIAAWDAKYHYDFWRPITAIQNADSDGNPNTIADANWTPLLTTPPFPEYVSGHSTFSGAAETILTGLLGNNVSFTTNSLGIPGVDRQFDNFTDAANEAGISRIYGGIHFNSANVEGLATGRSVGNYVLQNLLAPITETVQQLTVMPGEQLKLESQEIFGKNASFALESEETLPIGSLDSDGTLIFEPSPSQIGNYDFNLVARDGEEITTKKFNLAVVADSETTTRISGVIQNTDQQPLAGVKVKIGDISTTTAADGSFTLTLTEPSSNPLMIEPGQQVDNLVYPSIAEPLHLLLGHDVYANVKNVIDRPIYLPPIDISNAQTIDPNIDQVVTSAAIPGSAVTVFANSLFNQENQPYTGQLSITTVPTELTPAALPENLRPDLVVTIQPGEMVFTNPAPLSLPNLAGYAPGTEMDLWSINPLTGDFDDVGTGRVNADGTVIETIDGGIRNSSWHFFAPPTPTPNNPDDDDRNPDDGCDECKATAPGTSEVELHSGAVIETHDLVPYQSLGISRGISLRYDSERADARPILHFGYNDVPNDSALRLMAELTIKRGNFELEVPGFAGGEFGLDGGEHFWSIPNGGGKIDATLQADLRTLDSGRYDYDLTTGLLRLNNNQLNGSTSTTEGQFLHINTANSAFGSGWGLAGLQEIVVNPDESVIIIDGNGSELLFEKNDDNSYDSPVGDFSTLERLDDGTFRRRMTDQTVYTFNGENLLTKMRDRIGNETEYIYENRRLTKMVDPVGLETSFTYTNNRITAITDPSGRSTQLTYDANGNLTKITDPDGTSRTWEYDADHRMIAEVDKRGNREQTFYDFAGRADRAIRKDGSELDFDPVQVQGLYLPNQTIDPVNAPVAFQLGEVTSTYTDANGKQIVNILDQAGQIVSSSDEVGLLPSVERNEDNLVTQQTDARGNITSFTYDDNGNVLSIQNSLSFISPRGSALIISEGNNINAQSTAFIDGLVQNAGIATTIVNTVPNTLTGFTQVIDIRVENAFALTDLDKTLYLEFLQSGGNLLLVGENNNFATRNNSILDLIAAAGGGSLDFVEPAFVQEVLAPFNSPNPISDGNVTYGGVATGGVTSPGTGQFVTVDNANRGSTIYFDENDLPNALGGKLTVMFDTNFFLTTNDIIDNQNLINNIIGFERVDTRFTYDPTFNQLTSMTDELGHQTLYQIDPNNGNLLSINQVVGEVGGNDDIITQFTYTNNGLVDLITDPLGRITDSDYDANGRLISIIYAKGTTDEAKRQFEYDLAGNQTAVIDENGNLTQFEYDALNRLVKIIEADPDGAGLLTSPITTYDYDADGNLISITDAVGNVNQNTYDKLNRLVENIDELNQESSYSYDSLGNLLSVVDPLGNKTENLYDERNRLISTIDPKGVVTGFNYDLNNNLISVTENDKNGLVLFQDNFDSENNGRGQLNYSNLINWNIADGTIDLIGNGSNDLLPGNGLYLDLDGTNRNAGNLVSQKTFTLNPGIYTLQFSLAGSQRGDRNSVTVSFADIFSETFTLDSNAPFTTYTRTISVANSTTGNLILDHAGGDNRGLLLDNVKLSQTLSSSTSGLTNITTFAYDARNRLISETDPLGKNTQYQYDTVNNLIAKTDRNNRRTEFNYDDIDRLTQEIWVGTDQVINYSYDKASNQTAVNDKFSSLAFSYDNRDSLLSVNNAGTPGFSNVVLNYTYDKVGNFLSVVDTINGVAGGNNSYSYDALNRLTKLTQSGNNVSDKRVDFAYNSLGQYTSINRYANLTGTQLVNGTTYTYDSLNRLTNLNHSNGTNNVAFYNYAYDAASRITQISDIDGTTDYTYDNRAQLTGANHSNVNNPDESYTYDANGNRITSSIHGNGYVTGGGNRLLSDGKYNYEYDNGGNLTQQTEIATGKVQELTWDYRNRLVAFVDKDAAGNETQRVEFTYDAFNRRIAKAVDTNPQDTTPAVVTQFIYDGQNVLLEFVDSDGAGANQPVLDIRYLHGAGVDQVLAQESAGNVVWHLTDHLGTVRDLVNNSGAVVNHFVYDSFGQVISESNPAVDTRYLFTGREFDSETGLYYYRARYYDQTTGRFLSEDPLGSRSGDTNIYAALSNAPTIFVDPSGLKVEGTWIKFPTPSNIKVNFQELSFSRTGEAKAWPPKVIAFDAKYTVSGTIDFIIQCTETRDSECGTETETWTLSPSITTPPIPVTIPIQFDPVSAGLAAIPVAGPFLASIYFWAKAGYYAKQAYDLANNQLLQIAAKYGTDATAYCIASLASRK
ncbi:Ig-like domain-containing protein [Dolichospermum sp. UHCC 0259]|uniref:Ig-like domain-containing protein n=1 Tax=Dolichospermum sp. UHCC 0259 TaxID=2590010 RepID=UPI001C2D2652|nr:Ig-like domain-containing protein [Dolichospermum sp. UHCC 0259]